MGRFKSRLYTAFLNAWVKMSRKKRMKPRKKLRFEVEVAGHCNLNCKNCTHFSPLIKEEFVDVGVLERDFARLSELAGRDNERIKILGGEPLLHPEIVKIMQIARKYFDGPVYLNTNGILLTKMSEAFWQACHDNKIEILVSDYPINLNRKLIRQTAKRYKAKVTMRRFSSERKYAAGAYSWSRCQLDPKGGQDAENNYRQCFMINSCLFLRNGRMSTCCLPSTVQRFNDYYGENIEVSDENSIDIHAAKSIEEIYEFMVKPIPFCRYCKVPDWEFGIQWGISKKDKSEWADEPEADAPKAEVTETDNG